MRNIRYNTCTANMIYVHMLLSLRMLYVVYVAHIVSPLTHPHYILNMYTCITPIFNGNLFYANAVALILKMSLYYLTYEYDCKVELYILCDIADFQYYYINIDYTSMNINVRIRKGVVVQVYIFIMTYRIKQDLIYLYPNNYMNPYSLR